MDIDEFSKEMAYLVGEKMGPGYDVRVMENKKNNGFIRHSLNILNHCKNITPCIYLDGFYEKYVRGAMGLGYIADVVIGIYKENIQDLFWDTSSFTDYNRSKWNVRGRLVNTEKNRELLEELPHREFLDLSLIYAADYPEGLKDRGGSILVKKEHLKMWGTDEEGLFCQMKENMKNSRESLLRNMKTVLREIEGIDESMFEYMEKMPMYILTNKRKCNGAVEMLDEDALEEAAELYGGDFMILPSSIHEVLLLPARDEKEEIDGLAEMVRDVNHTQIAPEELLSYHVYRYNRRTGRVSIAV